MQSLVSPFHGAAWRRAPVVGYRRANVLKHYAEKISEGIDIWKQPVVIDAGSSAKFSRSYVGEVPCLTARRCSEKEGYWISTKGGPLEKSEMALLQGIECIGIWDDALLQELRIGEGVYDTLLGNAMSVNVLCHLIPAVLVAAGFATESEAAAMKADSGW